MNIYKFDKSNKSFKNILRYLNMLIRTNKIKLFIAFISMILVSGINLYKPQIIQRILDQAVENKDIRLLLQLSIIYVIIIILSAILNVSLEYFYSRIKKIITNRMKNKLLNHISKLSGSYFTERKTGNLLRILECDIYTIEDFGIDLFFNLILDLFTAIISVYFLFKIQSSLLMVVLILEFIIIYMQFKFTAKISKKIKEIREIAGESMNRLEEYISNILNIVICKGKLNFFNKYIKNEKEFINKGIKLDITMSLSVELAVLCNSLILISVYLIGGISIINNKMSIGQLIAFTQYTQMLLGPCIEIIKSNNKIQQTAVAINNIYDVLDEPIEIKQNNSAYASEYDFKGNIKINDLCFSYNQIDEVLHKVNIECKTGEITAIVGNSGCGKSTITKLLYRLWNFDSGEILIDGIPIEAYNLKFIRRKVCIICQDLLLFDDSIFNNIRYNSNASREEVYNICRLVGVDEFVSTLEDGYDTEVGERGIKLSGGQRQRIAVARALINDAKIMIFDEATSALDNISQKNLLNNIKHLLVDKTVIIITHRLETIKDSHKIYVMNNGRVVEQGMHNQLIEREGQYYSLINSSID